MYNILILYYVIKERRNEMKNWIDIEKFHTISIKKYSVTEIKKEDLTKRILLLSYFQISSLKYKNEEEIVKLLESLYDFKFKVRADQQGKYLLVCFIANAIDPKYINDKDYTLDKIFEAFNDLQTPLVINNSFDKKTFNKAKRELKAEIEKSLKYPISLANQFVRETYFKDTIRDFDPRGSLEELNKITIEELYNYYLEFQKEEKATYVLGNIDEKYKFPLENTLIMHEDQNFRQRAILDKDVYIKKAKSNQMYLRIVYDTKIFTGDLELYPLMILNHALGGSSYSHLFRIVREKYGLCYIIDSICYGASGIIVINAEIKSKDFNLVIEKIDEAIDSILENIDLEKIKKEFILLQSGAYDNPESYITDAFRHDSFIQAYDKDTYKKRIDCITIDDIKNVLKKLSKDNRKIFAYGGQNE